MILGIYGAGGLGREVLELSRIINRREERWTGFIFIDDGDVPEIINGIKVHQYEEAKKQFSSELEIVLAIGEPIIRKRILNTIRNDGIRTPTLIHPDVYIPETTEIGTGVIIQYGCFISCNVKIEDYVFIQPQVNVGHDDVLMEGCMLSGFVNLGGVVTVGKYTYIGLSSCVKQGIRIGNFSIISMGSVVYKDIPDEMIAVGNPARPMKKNDKLHIFK